MDAEPLVRITKGSPAPEELAALVTVLLARMRTAATARPETPVSRWARSARPTAATMTPEPGGWRAAALPR